jgi:acetyltransferase-like isoleucine patch superfamily enzyme
MDRLDPGGGRPGDLTPAADPTGGAGPSGGAADATGRTAAGGDLDPERPDEHLDDDLVDESLRHHVDRAVAAAVAREGTRRAARLGHDLAAETGLPPGLRLRPPPRLRYPGWGWRRAIRFGLQRRMYTREYRTLFRRYLWHRLRHPHVELQGLVFTGKRVELYARRGHGRLVVGPWCWIGNDNKLRAHEGQLTLGEKVVMGRDNVVNAYLDVEIGAASIVADWVYVVDFDHRFDRLDLPIKDQGIVKSPVRIGRDVWIGEKASVLRGVDVGDGSVVASHAVVNRSLPPFSIAVGVPARVVRSRLPVGIDPDDALALHRAGEPIPGDPLEEPGW